MRFWPKQWYRSITYSQSAFHIMENGHLKLSNIGELRMFQHPSICGEIGTITITKDALHFPVASFSVMPVKPSTVMEKTGKGIGTDMGLRNPV